MSVLVKCPHCATRVLPLAGRICPACRKNVDAPPEPAPPPAQVVDEVYRIAAQRLSEGAKPRELESLLNERGLDARGAAEVAGRLKQTQPALIRRAAVMKMRSGAGWFLAGLIITVWTYTAAPVLGGSFFIAWGAILVGAFEFLRGLMLLADSPSQGDAGPRGDEF